MKFCTFPDCESYTMNEQSEYCATHAHHLRKESRDSKKAALKKPKHLPKFSEKKASKILPYAVLRRRYLDEHPVCEVHLTGCTGLSEEIHHCGTEEKDFLNTKTWKAVCRHDHNVIERILSAKKRRELGLLI